MVVAVDMVGTYEMAIEHSIKQGSSKLLLSPSKLCMWRGIEGHDQIVRRFERAIAAGRLASTYLFAGESGIGKRLFARHLAGCLMCQRPPSLLDMCESCVSCEMWRSGNHPDLLEIAPVDDKRALSIDQLIGSREHRHREGLCHDIALRPFAAARRVAVIECADTLNTESANALLKTLEEPPPRSVLILLSSSESRQLPTIRSRCQIIRFRPLCHETVCDLLSRQYPDAGPRQIEMAAAHCGGSLDRAAQLMDATLWQLRELVLKQLGSGRPDAVAVAAAVQEATDAAGSDAGDRRAFLEGFLIMIVDSIRERVRLAVAEQQATPQVEALVEAAVDALQAGDMIHRNIHLANLVLWWSQRVCELSRFWPQTR
jgi:DNA polymerase-3 subunit delta'